MDGLAILRRSLSVDCCEVFEHYPKDASSANWKLISPTQFCEKILMCNQILLLFCCYFKPIDEKYSVEDAAQWESALPSMCEPLNSIPSTETNKN